MENIVLEYTSLKDAKEDLDKLWGKHKISGELALKPAGEDRWYLEITGEKDLNGSILEKLKGRRL